LQQQQQLQRQRRQWQQRLNGRHLQRLAGSKVVVAAAAPAVAAVAPAVAAVMAAIAALARAATAAAGAAPIGRCRRRSSSSRPAGVLVFRSRRAARGAAAVVPSLAETGTEIETATECLAETGGAAAVQAETGIGNRIGIGPVR
jgi:hypothetical protein